ncbi:hypothetical protein F183_A41780 [Bryobacterales bacterium F-183]|nr:hypothetical protein F183_A41780 [Bryobacterales bacterium F-183]
MATQPNTRKRAEVINIRASQRQKAMIDQAAQSLGRTRSDFMLESACREAQSVLLDRTHFTLEPATFRRFLAELDRPPRENAKLRKLLSTPAPWD